MTVTGGGTGGCGGTGVTGVGGKDGVMCRERTGERGHGMGDGSLFDREEGREEGRGVEEEKKEGGKGEKKS